MDHLNLKRSGFATAMTLTLLYAGCALVMATVSHENAIAFFNSILHGVDVTNVVRWNMPWTEMIVGLLETFILGWLIGSAFAVFYNFTSPRRLHDGTR